MTANELEVGTRIYYTGDMANAPGHFEVTFQMGSVLKLTELSGGENRTFRINIGQIGNVYQGHCSPRFVTEEARQSYRDELERRRTRYEEIKAGTDKVTKRFIHERELNMNHLTAEQLKDIKTRYDEKGRIGVTNHELGDLLDMVTELGYDRARLARQVAELQEELEKNTAKYQKIQAIVLDGLQTGPIG